MKFLTHNRDTVGDFQARVLLHIPIGFVMGLTSIFPFAGYGLVRLFIAYEQNEDFRCGDWAWKDYFGAIIGYVIGVLVGLTGFCFALWFAFKVIASLLFLSVIN